MGVFANERTKNRNRTNVLNECFFEKSGTFCTVGVYRKRRIITNRSTVFTELNILRLF